MPETRHDTVLWGLTRGGRTFRPSDWTDRLAGLTAAFKLSDRFAYSPLVEPATVKGVKALIVSGDLEQREPRLYRFLLNFAKDNELLTTTCPEAIENPQALTPPKPPARGVEPHEPV